MDARRFDALLCMTPVRRSPLRRLTVSPEAWSVPKGQCSRPRRMSFQLARTSQSQSVKCDGDLDFIYVERDTFT